MSGFRPRVLLLSAVAVLALAGAFDAGAVFTAAPAQAWRDLSVPDTVPVPVAAKSEPGARGFIWSATRIESSIRLRGSVPSDEHRRTVLGMVKAHFPDLEVEDRLKVTKGAPPQDQWLGAVSFGLQQLSHLKRGSARLLNVALRVDGEARSAVDYVEVKKALAGPLPTGLTIAKENIKPPVADPFIFVADLGANALSLSGSIPSEDARKQVRELSRQLFRRPGLDDRLELASGAPKDWDEAVVAALRALSQLEFGEDRPVGTCRDDRGCGAGQRHGGRGFLPAQTRLAGVVLHLREHQLERGVGVPRHRRARSPAHQGNCRD